MTLHLLAPAKVNLRLEVLKRLPSGYHQLRMINIAIDLCDEIKLELISSGFEIEIEGWKVEGENLVIKAFRYFCEKFNKKFGIRVLIKKRIPPGAGLGGGSSDAGAVLRGLCRHFGIDLNQLNLKEIAYNLGADIPFCVFSFPSWVEGIGENIEPIENFPEVHLLLLKPEFSTSTSKVFNAWKDKRHLTVLEKEYILSRLYQRDWERVLFNDLEKVVFKMHPGLAQLKSLLKEAGADGVVMSGSGPTIVGVFSTQEKLNSAEQKIRKERPGLWLVSASQYQPESEQKI